jgi:multidrug resistance protein, MATE family
MPPSSVETDPLLPKVAPSTSDQDVETQWTSSSAIDDACLEEEGCIRQFGDIKAESKLKLFFSLLVDSIPGKLPARRLESDPDQGKIVILSYTLQNSVQTISIVITGRLGPHELSVAAFSLMLAFVTGESRYFRSA